MSVVPPSLELLTSQETKGEVEMMSIVHLVVLLHPKPASWLRIQTHYYSLSQRIGPLHLESQLEAGG